MSTQTDVEQYWKDCVEPFTDVVRAVEDWDASTPCKGWSAQDLLDHVVVAERDFAARQGREIPVFDGSRNELWTQWVKHASAVTALAGDETFIMQSLHTATGDMTVGEALLHFHGFDLLVHRWDLARSQGRDEQWTDEEMDRIERALDSFGEQAYQPGILADPVPVADDAPRQVRLLGRLGRRA